MGRLSQKWSKIALVTDENVKALYANQISEKWVSHGEAFFLHLISVGESSKSRKEKEILEDFLFENGFDRQSAIVALGGGVVGDLAGFVASTFLRGIDFVYIPTTLIAMVDASIGGKCGINTPYGKNLLGSFYPPCQVVVDTSFLKSLPDLHWKEGMAEIIKASLVADRGLFEALEKPVAIDDLINWARKIKQEIIERDLHENGERRCLNFGHTVAHAIEKVSGYEISHGEAVWFGLLVEAEISSLLGFLSRKELASIQALLFQKKYELKRDMPFSAEEIFSAMKGDKKNKNGECRMVVLEKIGKAASFDGNYCLSIAKEVFNEAYESVRGVFGHEVHG